MKERIIRLNLPFINYFQVSKFFPFAFMHYIFTEINYTFKGSIYCYYYYYNNSCYYFFDLSNFNDKKYLLTRWYLRIPNRSKKINNSYESALFNTLQLSTVENIYVPLVINFIVLLGRQMYFYSSLSTLSQRFLSHYVIYLWKYAHRWRCRQIVAIWN